MHTHTRPPLLRTHLPCFACDTTLLCTIHLPCFAWDTTLLCMIHMPWLCVHTLPSAAPPCFAYFCYRFLCINYQQYPPWHAHTPMHFRSPTTFFTCIPPTTFSTCTHYLLYMHTAHYLLYMHQYWCPALYGSCVQSVVVCDTKLVLYACEAGKCMRAKLGSVCMQTRVMRACKAR